jgi:ureidoacrylate peracid hydrolase
LKPKPDTEIALWIGTLRARDQGADLVDSGFKTRFEGKRMRRPVLSTLEEKVDPSRACVLVIDVQNEFCARSGAFHRTGHGVDLIEAMVPNLLEFIDRARAVGCPVIFARAIYDEHFLAPNWQDPDILCNLAVPRCRTGTWGAEFYRVEPRPREIVVTKHRYSAFIETELDTILRARGVETLILTGVATNVCVESTARDGFMKDYYIVVVDDCTGTSSLGAQQATLENIRNYFGRVASSADIIKAWLMRAPAAPPPAS